MRGPLRRALVAAFIAPLLLGACDRPERAAPLDTIDSIPARPIAAARPASDLNGWNEAGGPALFVPSETPFIAAVIVPSAAGSLGDSQPPFDLSPLVGVRVRLFSRAGVAASAVVAPPVTREMTAECASWPHVSLRSIDGSAADQWLAGFAAPEVTPIPLDSIEMLASADSARLVAEIARLASTIPESTEQAFRGLPFSVRSARRFQPAPGVSAVVAEVARRITTEANPREERTLLIAERDSAGPGAPTGRYRLAYFERSAGAEEAVVTPEVLSVVQLGSAAVPTMVISRDDGQALRYVLVERTGPAQWRARWTSGYAVC